MRDQHLIEEAKACRTHARTVTRSERELLLKIADAFEEMASVAEARKAVAETRCW
jgi:hypothetical protein